MPELCSSCLLALHNCVSEGGRCQMRELQKTWEATLVSFTILLVSRTKWILILFFQFDIIVPLK